MTRDPLELAERLERYPRLSDDSFRAAYTHGDMRETLAEAAACIREMHDSWQRLNDVGAYDLVCLWYAYARCDDDQLDESGQKLKEHLLSLVSDSKSKEVQAWLAEDAL